MMSVIHLSSQNQNYRGEDENKLEAKFVNKQPIAMPGVVPSRYTIGGMVTNDRKRPIKSVY